MCMITYVPAGIEIPWEGIENGARTNNDGHGWAIASAMGLEVGKSMDFTEAAVDLDAARDRHGKNSIVIFHSRWGTHGVLGEFNVHPFYVDDEKTTVMAHNGILPGRYHPVKGDPRSDTRIFTDRVAGDYINPETGVPSRRRGKHLGDLITGGNKLIFLSVAGGEPKVRIINAWMGEWEGGVWYSNTGYKASRFWGSYGVGSRTAGSCATGRRWDYEDEYDGWDPTWSTRYEEWKAQHGLADDPEDKDSGTKTPGTKEVIINGQVVEVSEDNECVFCGAVDAIDPMISICMICEACQDCKETAADCQCYTVPHQEKPSHLFALPELPGGWRSEVAD